MYTTKELADELGITNRALLAWLRRHFADEAPNPGKQWNLTLPMIIAAARLHQARRG